MGDFGGNVKGCSRHGYIDLPRLWHSFSFDSGKCQKFKKIKINSTFDPAVCPKITLQEKIKLFRAFGASRLDGEIYSRHLNSNEMPS
jgi:hypothetical protein